MENKFYPGRTYEKRELYGCVHGRKELYLNKRLPMVEFMKNGKKFALATFTSDFLI
jgi:hypothetical protein